MNPQPMGPPSGRDIQQAHRQIASLIHRTPVLRSDSLDRLSGSRLFFKCENFQKSGSFKFRGASHALSTLDRAQASRGVTTHSSGNHAQALSLAARLHGISAYVVMPETALRVKVEAVEAYGGHIRFCMPTLEAREEGLKAWQAETGAEEIHPYNDYRTITGQATAAAELFEEVKQPDYLIVPVGGGGLLSGSILSAHYFSPTTRVIGAEPQMADDAWQSLQKKELVPSAYPQTIADGLRTSLGSLTFPIIMEGVHDILTASEEAIVEAMRIIWERMKIIIEPSAALPLAVILEHPEAFRDKQTALVLSGGNADLLRIPWLETTSFSKH